MIALGGAKARKSGFAAAFEAGEEVSERFLEAAQHLLGGGVGLAGEAVVDDVGFLQLALLHYVGERNAAALPRLDALGLEDAGLDALDVMAQTQSVTKSTAIDSTYIKAQRAAFGAKGGVRHRRLAARGAAGQQRSTRSPTSSAVPMR